MVEVVLFHGSENRIEKPIYGYGKSDNDYGLGFYCTRDRELAAEWACSEEHDGFVNRYHIDLDGLNVIDLDSPPYTILNWLEILLDNRDVHLSPDLKQPASWMKENAYVDLSDADIIIGYRADDSFFRYTRRFLDGSVSIEMLSKAMHLGGLGIQTMLKSRKAFDAITFDGAEEVLAKNYYERYNRRDTEVREAFDSMLGSEFVRGIRIFDLMSGEVSKDDPRLQ